MKILLKKATIIDSQSVFHCKKKDILIDKGVIQVIEDNIKPSDEKVIEFENLHLSKGWFDNSVSFGEPGFEERETIHNGLLTAAKSGFTVIVLNPNTNPVLDSHANISHVLKTGCAHTTQLLVSGTLSENAEGRQMAPLYDMHLAGAIAFGDYKKPIENPNLLRISLDYLQSFNGLLLSYPIDVKLAEKGLMHEGSVSTGLGLNAIPSVAETTALARDIQLLEYTNGKLHIPFISSAKSIELIREAKKSGLNISCGVGLHHLTFTDEVLKEYDANFKLTPPLREATDRRALREALLDGTIDMVSSMHEPVNSELKTLEFNRALEGSIGLEAAFGILNSIFTLEETIDFLTRGRERFQIQSPKIEVNNPANFSLFNPDARYTLEESYLFSTSKNCAFIGCSMRGRVYGSIREKYITLTNYE